MIQFIPIAISLAATLMQSQAEDEAGETAKRIGEYNATVDESDALQLELDSLESVRRMRAEGKRFVGSQRARYAKGGVVVDTRSPLEVMAETEGMLKLQELDYERQARQQAAKLRRSAQMSRFYGEKELRASRVWSLASLLAGVGNDASMYFNARAQMSRFYGAKELKASSVRSSASLLAGVGNAASMYFNARGKA